MPYIDTNAWMGARLEPTHGEGYAAFMERCVPGVVALKPQLTADECNAICESAWAAHVMQNATEVTVTLKRDFYTYNDSMYLEGWYSDWEVAEIHTALMAQMNVTYSALEKAKVATGEVFKIAKSKTDEQLVFGWANVAIDETGQYPLDWDGDVTAPEDLEKAAYDFVLKHRVTGEQHEGEAKGNLVESVMFTKEKQEALGIPEGLLPQGWWVGFHVPDKEVFEKIKSGEYEMFSVQGSGYRAATGV